MKAPTPLRPKCGKRSSKTPVRLEPPSSYVEELATVSGWLSLKKKIECLLDAHELISNGLPARSFHGLLETLSATPRGAIEAAVGMSTRTLQRKRAKTHKPLSREQGGRIWKFAEVLAKATDVFGSKEEAEAWLSRPATGLNDQRPIDLLTTPAGVDLVETFLTRLAYGVYV